MKTGIHPEYVTTEVSCGCGNHFTTRSTEKSGKINLGMEGVLLMGAMTALVRPVKRELWGQLSRKSAPVHRVCQRLRVVVGCDVLKSASIPGFAKDLTA